MKKKKKKIINLFKTGILLFGISLLLWNCEKETIPFENNTANTAKSEPLYLNSSQIPLIANSLKTKHQEVKQKYLSKSNKSIEHIEIDYQKILKVKDSVGNYSFSFNVKNQSLKRFVNIIVKKDSIGNILPPFVVQYTLEKSFYQKFKNDNNVFNKFSGNIQFFTLEKFLEKNNLFLKQSSCPEDEGLDFQDGSSDGDDDQSCIEVARIVYWCPPGGYQPTAHPKSVCGNPWGSGPGTVPVIKFLCVDQGGGNGDGRLLQKGGNDCDGSSGGGGTSPSEGGTNIGVQIPPANSDCPEGYDQNGKCVEEVQIFNELTGKAKCVYEKLTESSTDFKNAIKKFDGEFPVSHLNLIMEDLGNTRGETRAPNGAGSSPDYVITIAINSNSNIHGVGYRPNLMTAKTIAHEVIHAEMFRKLLSVLDNGGNIAGVTRQNVLDALDGDFPGMYDYYRRHKNWQHQQMATHYRETIADVLKGFDNNQNSNQFYMDLAWEGLKYPSISTWSSQTQQEKDRINKVISDYINANKNQSCQ